MRSIVRPLPLASVLSSGLMIAPAEAVESTAQSDSNMSDMMKSGGSSSASDMSSMVVMMDQMTNMMDACTKMMANSGNNSTPAPPQK